jgi:hypothetical protein
MKPINCLSAISFVLLVFSCDQATHSDANEKKVPLAGTWKLLTGTLIEKGDTTVTDYTRNVSFIKVINDTHFAFMSHDLAKGADSTAVYSSGGGTYTLRDSTYTEHLEYCSARNWEGHDFSFTIRLSNDTLIQQGIEKIESEGIERMNIEKYVRAGK